MSITLYRAQIAFILKHAIVASEGFSKLIHLSCFPFLLWNAFYEWQGLWNIICSFAFLWTLGFAILAETWVFSLCSSFPLCWVLCLMELGKASSLERKWKKKIKLKKAASAFRNTTLVPRHLKGWKGPLGYPPAIQELYFILHITIAPARVIDYYETISSSKFPADWWRTRCTLLSHICVICWVCGYFCWITSMSSLLHRRKKSLSLSHRFPVVVGGFLYVGVIRALRSLHQCFCCNIFLCWTPPRDKSISQRRYHTQNKWGCSSF